MASSSLRAQIRKNVSDADLCFSQLKFEDSSRYYKQALIMASSLVSSRGPHRPDTIRSFAEVYRKFGLSLLFAEKWRKGGDDVFENATEAFFKSLNWSQKDRQFHLENTQAMSFTLFDQSPIL